MARYIDADKLKDEIMDARLIRHPTLSDTRDVMSIIESQPTADVVEVKHGEWIGRCGTGQYDDYYCSHCNMYEEYTRNKRLLGKYCSYCGARMDGE